MADSVWKLVDGALVNDVCSLCGIKIVCAVVSIQQSIRFLFLLFLVLWHLLASVLCSKIVQSHLCNSLRQRDMLIDIVACDGRAL